MVIHHVVMHVAAFKSLPSASEHIYKVSFHTGTLPYREAPPRGPTPYPFIYHFWQKRYPKVAKIYCILSQEYIFIWLACKDISSARGLLSMKWLTKGEIFTSSFNFDQNWSASNKKMCSKMSIFKPSQKTFPVGGLEKYWEHFYWEEGWYFAVA